MSQYLLHLQRQVQSLLRGRLIVAVTLAMVSGGSLVALYTYARDYYPPPAQPVLLHYDNAMTLTGYTLSPTTGVQGGDELHVTMDWRADMAIRARYVVHIQLLDARGHLWADHVNEPANGKARTDRWMNGQRVIDTHTLDLPSTMPGGDYKLAVIVYDPDVEWNLPVRNAAGRMIADQPVIGDVHIGKNKSPILENGLKIEQPQKKDLGDLTLLGFIPNSALRVSRGEPIHVGVYWRARVKPENDYVIAIQVRDNSGNVQYENASRPAANTYPTIQWDAGEVLLDWHDFPIPITFRADPYQMFMVVRDADTQQAIGDTKIMNFSVVR